LVFEFALQLRTAAAPARINLSKHIKIALEAGADCIGFADTVGSLCPWQVEDIIHQLRCQLDDPDIEVHFHDDRGTAAANALSAVRAGARWVSSSINGIGERSGITDTLALLVNLHALNWRSLQNGHGIPYASSLVQTHAPLPVDKSRPIVGDNSFTHVAKLHRRAMLRDERTYTWGDPSLFGRVNSFGVSTPPPTPKQLINKRMLLSSVEIRHHRHRPGDGYFFPDEHAASDSRQYCAVPRIPELKDYGPGHTDRYRYSVDTICLFLGNEDDLRGLSVEVFLDNETFVVNSPSSVLIPSGMMHSYRVIEGKGLFVNHVLVGDYNSSLPGSPHISSSIAETASSVTYI
jgi:2-isopropylmalate synthase